MLIRKKLGNTKQRPMCHEEWHFLEGVLSETFIEVRNGICDSSSILDQAVCVSLCANVLRKGMNPTVPPPTYAHLHSYREIVRQTQFFSLASQGERKL